MQIKDRIKLEDKEKSLKTIDQLFENYEAKTLVYAMKANDSVMQLECIAPLIKEFSNIDVESINNKVQIESYVYILLNKLEDTIGKIPENIQQKIDKCKIYLDCAQHSKISEEEFKEAWDVLASIAEDLIKTNSDLLSFPEEIMKTSSGITNQQNTVSSQKQKPRSLEESLEKEDTGQIEDFENLKKIAQNSNGEKTASNIIYIIEEVKKISERHKTSFLENVQHSVSI